MKFVSVILVILSCWLIPLNAFSQKWQAAASLHYARSEEQAVTLPDGRVFVAGGFNDSGLVLPCEIYQPRTDSWIVVGSLNQGRYRFQLVVLADLRVLAAGGLIDRGVATTSTCEIYDPKLDKWKFTTPMSNAREEFASLLLPDSTVLLHAGLDANTSTLLSGSDRFDPGTGTMSAMPNVLIPHYAMNAFNSYALNGIVSRGGQVGGGSGTSLADLEILTYGGTAWLKGPLSAVPHSTPAGGSVQLSDESILVPTGRLQSGTTTRLVEIFDCGKKKWRTLDPIDTAHDLPQTVVVGHDTGFVVAGAADPGSYNTVLDNCVFIDPVTGRNWEGPRLNTARFRHKVVVCDTPLPGDSCSFHEEVLVIGGETGDGTVLSSCEKLDLGNRPTLPVVQIDPKVIEIWKQQPCANSFDIMLTASGCVTTSLVSVTAEDSLFQVSPSPGTLPYSLPPGKVIELPLTLSFQSDTISGAIKFVFASSAGQITRYIHLDRIGSSLTGGSLLMSPEGLTHGYLTKSVSYPLRIQFGHETNADSLLRLATRSDYELSFDSSELQVQTVIPPAGWLLNSQKVVGGSLKVAFTKSSSSVHALDSLGQVVFNVIGADTKHTTLELTSFSLTDSSGVLPFCIYESEGASWVILLDSLSQSVQSGMQLTSVGDPYPNPSNTSACIVAATDRDEALDVRVFDVLGSEVAKVENRTRLHPGKNLITVNTEALSPAMYYVRVAIGGNIYTRVLNVSR